MKLLHTFFVSCILVAGLSLQAQVISKNLSVQQADSLIKARANDASFVVLDIRTDMERAGGYLENSVFVNFLIKQGKDKMWKLDRNKAYLIYCRSGKRSKWALDLMKEKGFKEVYNMLGGIKAWKAAGLKVGQEVKKSRRQEVVQEGKKGKGEEEIINRFFEPLLTVPEGVQVLQTSSHNKTGQNWDEYWPQYVDNNGEEVIFDVAGPGCIKQMWGTNFDPEGIIKFYFDGEKEPQYQCRIIDFYKGNADFLDGKETLVSYERRGKWGDAPFAGNSFLPIPFNKHLKVAIQGVAHFYHIIYEKYPLHNQDNNIKFASTDNDIGSLTSIIYNLDKLWYDTSDYEEYTFVMKEPLKPGESVPLFKDSLSGGVIREVIIEGDGSEDFFREVYIRMKWDSAGRYQVMAPIGIFFGSANKSDSMSSLPLEVIPLPDGRARLVCRFPMPYTKAAEINLLNWSTKTFVEAHITLKIDRKSSAISNPDMTYFTTLYNEGETIYGHDWLLFEGAGSGWYVGTVQSMRQQHYCEGDEHFYIDGALSPQINGTGSEDYYLACFWPNNDFDTPFGCVVGDIGIEGGGYYFNSYEVPSCYSRYHLEAPIPFYSGISAKIQHGGLSHIISQYRSVSFVYINPKIRLKQTDYIDVGNTVSESGHRYKSTKSKYVENMQIHPEGDFFESTLTENGRVHGGGVITYTAAIDPANKGVRLRRLLDQVVPRQKAEVFVDGKSAGTWYLGYENEHLRAYEQDFDIHPDLTRGKSSIKVRLVIDGNFSDLNYTVYSFL